jgi:hypothetical protein
MQVGKRIGLFKATAHELYFRVFREKPEKVEPFLQKPLGNSDSIFRHKS